MFSWNMPALKEHTSVYRGVQFAAHLTAHLGLSRSAIYSTPVFFKTQSLHHAIIIAPCAERADGIAKPA